MEILKSVISSILGALRDLMVPLIAYYQGQKAEKQKANEKVIKEAKDAQKDKNTITDLDDDVRDNLVYRSTSDSR